MPGLLELNPGASHFPAQQPRSLAKLPLDTADLATHVLWKLEGRADVLHAISQFIANVERDGTGIHSIAHSGGSGELPDRDIAVRSLFALTSLSYNERLRDRICDSPGFLSLVVQRATSTDEPTLATAYMGLLYRLTFRMSGSSQLPSFQRDQLLDFLAARATAAAATAAAGTAGAEPPPFIGVLANLTKGCLSARSYMKSQSGAPELYRALAQLLIGPGTLCIVFALQALASLVLHEPLGAALFAEDNLRRVFEIVFSLVKEADQDEQAHHALRAASDLLADLFLSPRILELVGRVSDVVSGQVVGLLETIATLRHSLDPALPLLELACTLLRPPSFRAELLRAARSEKAERARLLATLLSLASCQHVDVASAAAELLIAFCHDSAGQVGRTLDAHDRCHAVKALTGVIGVSAQSNHKSVLEPQDGGIGLRLRRHAACRLLRELSQTVIFRKDVLAGLHLPSLVKEAKSALHNEDGSFVLMLLLLGFECVEGALAADFQELLLLVRSQTVVDMWAEVMGSSKNVRALYECLFVACKLLPRSVDGDASSTSQIQITKPLPSWIEVQMLVDALAAHHHVREREMENLQLKLRQVEGERDREQNQARQAKADYEAELKQEAEMRESERRRQSQEAQTSFTQLAEARRRGDEALNAVSQESAALAQMRARFEAAERRLEDAEITHADLLQRALKAENMCRQLSAKVEEQDVDLQRAHEDREGLLGEVERRQRAEYGLAEITQTAKKKEIEFTELEQQKLALQRENTMLADANSRLQEELQNAHSVVEDEINEAQRRVLLLDTRAEDLGHRLASASAATRSAEMARDDALREASWLRCELATFQRLEHDRESRRNGRSIDTDTSRQHLQEHLATVEQRLRERAKQAHSDALESSQLK